MSEEGQVGAWDGVYERDADADAELVRMYLRLRTRDGGVERDLALQAIDRIAARLRTVPREAVALDPSIGPDTNIPHRPGYVMPCAYCDEVHDPVADPCEAQPVAVAPEPEETAQDFFGRLVDLAQAKDIAENGPNKELEWRSLHAVKLTINEILHVLYRIPDNLGKD